MYILLTEQKKENFFRSKVISSFEEFKKCTNVIVANRCTEELTDVADKVYTRDLYGRD